MARRCPSEGRQRRMALGSRVRTAGQALLVARRPHKSLPSEREANAELHLPGNRRRGGGPAERRRCNIDRVDGESPARWHLEDWVIEGIQHLRAEFHAEPLVNEG